MKSIRLNYFLFSILLSIVCFVSCKEKAKDANNSNGLIGDWTLSAFELPEGETYEKEKEMWDSIAETLKKACKKKSMRIEFSQDLTFTTFDDENKTARSGSFTTENGSLSRLYRTDDKKLQTPDVQRIVKLTSTQLVLETYVGFRMYYVKNK